MNVDWIRSSWLCGKEEEVLSIPFKFYSIPFSFEFSFYVIFSHKLLHFFLFRGQFQQHFTSSFSVWKSFDQQVNFANILPTEGQRAGLVVSELNSWSKGCGFKSCLIQYTRWKWDQSHWFLHPILVHCRKIRKIQAAKWDTPKNIFHISPTAFTQITLRPKIYHRKADQNSFMPKGCL